MKQKGYMHGGLAYSLFICCKEAVHIDSALLASAAEPLILFTI